MYRLSPHRHRIAWTMLEVLVGVVILSAGILSIATIVPAILKSQRDAELLSVAVSLAHQKAEEIRRDDSSNKRLIQSIRTLKDPTTPIVFPWEPRLAYSFYGKTLLSDAPGNAGGNRARVIIRKAPEYSPRQEVVYELQFE